MNFESLIKTAQACGCTVATNVPMAQMTTFRVGGPADLLVTVPDAAALTAIVACCRRENIPWFWLGNGSNLLVGDRGIRGAVLHFDSRAARVSLVDDTTVYCNAGMTLQRLCLFARDNSLTGLEFAYGIPGTVGGAVYMNAGAYGGEMAQVVERIDGVTADGTPVTLNADELALGYRHSALMDRADDERVIVTGVYFKLNRGEQGAIAARMKELIGKRQEKQPLEFPSAGSFFKRPQGHFAGALVEQAGLKGYRVGDAQVSEKHAGFVVNRGNATAKDLCQLCEDVQAAVWKSAKVRLEPEVRFVGEF
ncbi:MAG: UDP-N-acetylmuramate dehydrogenase [Clostridia bacterium]|nr:UDP-N-acetylmuramate dehydrogenase [Clostridia bacterium]